MSSIFSGFERGGDETAGPGDRARSADSQAEQRRDPDTAPHGPTGEQPIAAVPADQAGNKKPTIAAAPEIVPGVPLWTFENPYGDQGISWLAGLDLDATHEVNQPSNHAGQDGEKQVNGLGDPIARTGGAAYYFNAVTGRGFSVPVGGSEA